MEDEEGAKITNFAHPIETLERAINLAFFRI